MGHEFEWKIRSDFFIELLRYNYVREKYIYHFHDSSGIQILIEIFIK